MELSTILRQYAGFVGDPHLLLFVTLAHLARWLDEFIYVELLTIRDTEYRSGHGPYGVENGRPGLGQVTALSRSIGTTLVTLANCSRHQDIARSLAEFIKRKSTPGFMEDFGDPLTALEQQLQGGAQSVKYLQERTKSQSSVVSNQSQA
jgi:hypothetical protein